MSARLRIVGWNVQPVVMLDDGENLTAVPVGPQMIPAAAWEEFKAGGDQHAIASLREQVANRDTGTPNP